MCLIGIAWQAHPDLPLVVAANRDEFHGRPTAAAGFWRDTPRVLAGRDLEAGGTWMGVTRDGRFAALSNYREGADRHRAPRSRGHLVSGFLMNNAEPEDYATRAVADGDHYGGFNLLVADQDVLYYASNRGLGPLPVSSGVHALSNALLDTPWPKTARLRLALEAAIVEEDAGDAGLEGRLLDALADDRPASDTDLPDTGVGPDRERVLSPPFIRGDAYGTRASSVLWVRADGTAALVERRFGPDGRRLGEDRFDLRLTATPGLRRAAG